MRRFRGVAISSALLLGIFGCGAQCIEPAPTAPASASGVHAPGDIARWRPAVENYVPSVKPQNAIRLNGARVPFAKYLNQVHARIHPIFADRGLASLDYLPTSTPVNRPDLKVMLEIILESRFGSIHRMGVATSSGVAAFDVLALDSVDRAQPFGTPPRAIVSADGFVYFHWEFHRGPEACGTWNTRPFLLGSAWNAAPTAP